MFVLYILCTDHRMAIKNPVQNKIYVFIVQKVVVSDNKSFLYLFWTVNSTMLHTYIYKIHTICEERNMRRHKILKSLKMSVTCLTIKLGYFSYP